MKRKRVCPICKKEYSEYPALSRKDDKTEICPSCGTEEALEEWIGSILSGETSNDTKKYDVYSEFDIEKHKATYTNYLEVIVLESGDVVYAVPSHQEKAVKLCCERYNLTREELQRRCPPEYYGDYIRWLMMKLHAISVWTDGCVFDSCNHAQLHTMRILKMNGLYKGSLPRRTE